jgi:hypothetical protein
MMRIRFEAVIVDCRGANCLALSMFFLDEAELTLAFASPSSYGRTRRLRRRKGDLCAGIAGQGESIEYKYDPGSHRHPYGLACRFRCRHSDSAPNSSVSRP